MATLADTPNYGCNEEKFDDTIHHKDCSFSNNNKTVKNHHLWSTNRSCYGIIQIPSTKNLISIWTISIDSFEVMTGSITIGIDSIQQPNTRFYRNTNSPNYAYRYSGHMYKYGKTSNSSTRSAYREGDQITMKLDTARGTLQFYKNDPSLTNTANSLQITLSIQRDSEIAYKLAAAIKDAKISIIAFEIHIELEKSRQELNKLQSDDENISEQVEDQKEAETNANLSLNSSLVMDINENIERFKELYNEESLSMICKKNPMKLVDEKSSLYENINECQNMVRDMIECLTSFDEYIKETKSRIHSMISPDTKEYKDWDIDAMIIWIAMLENGRFVKYLEVLRDGFIKSEIVKGKYLPDLDVSVLTLKPFNISSFPDKKDLIQYFKKLRCDKEVEGVTVYH